jgi:hypothetical protein
VNTLDVKAVKIMQQQTGKRISRTQSKQFMEDLKNLAAQRQKIIEEFDSQAKVLADAK